MLYRDLELTFSMGDFMFTVLSITQGKFYNSIPKHSHSKNSYELHYISYGYGTLIANNSEYDIVPGTIFMTGPGIEHEQISSIENPMTEYCIYLKVHSHKKRKSNANSLVQFFLDHSFWIDLDRNSCYELMKHILRELETQSIGYELVLQALLQQVIVQMIRNYKENNNTETKTISSSQNVNDLTYLMIEEAFLYHYKDITLGSLSKQIGLSKRQTERLLQMHYNKTFLQKKSEARMYAACTLLRDTDRSISSIAYDLGYTSVEHFSNAFKRYFHKTASEYRKLKNDRDLHN